MIKCGWCNGRGSLTHNRKWMQNGSIKTDTYIAKCPVCKGEGKLQSKSNTPQNKENAE